MKDPLQWLKESTPTLNLIQTAAPAFVVLLTKHVPNVKAMLASELHLPVCTEFILLMIFHRRDNCKRCGGTGMTGSPCPVHAATGSYVSANNLPANGGNTGYGSTSGS